MSAFCIGQGWITTQKAWAFSVKYKRVHRITVTWTFTSYFLNCTFLFVYLFNEGENQPNEREYSQYYQKTYLHEYDK